MFTKQKRNEFEIMKGNIYMVVTILKKGKTVWSEKLYQYDFVSLRDFRDIKFIVV